MLMMALAFMSCEPGKSLDPTPTVVTPIDTTGTDMPATITVTSAPASVLPGDTASIELSVTDTSGALLKGAKLSVTSTAFSLLLSSSANAFDLDSLPDDGKVSFRIFSSTPGNGTVNIKVVSGKKTTTKSIAVLITEKPVAPKVMETLPKSVAAKETTLVVFSVVDSAAGKTPGQRGRYRLQRPVFDLQPRHRRHHVDRYQRYRRQGEIPGLRRHRGRRGNLAGQGQDGGRHRAHGDLYPGGFRGFHR